MKELIIQCTKCVLVLDEIELLQNLPPGVLERALRKGKGYRRCEKLEQREQSEMSMSSYKDADIYGYEGAVKSNE